MLGLKLTPETVILLPIAIIIDTISLLLLFIGLDDFFLLDWIGMIVIGGWLLLKKNDSSLIKKGKKKSLKTIEKIFTNKSSRFLVTIGGEIIPYLGVLPFWTIATIFNLSK